MKTLEDLGYSLRKAKRGQSGSFYERSGWYRSEVIAVYPEQGFAKKTVSGDYGEEPGALDVDEMKALLALLGVKELNDEKEIR